MIIRQAEIEDIPQIQIIRNAVKENRLSDPGLVTNEDCAHFIKERGKGWVCEENGKLTGFAIADLQDHNIWALFVHPDCEHRGVGKLLHDTMMNWYFTQTTQTVWLGTAPGTRAANFYRKAGWKETGTNGKNEIRFEMTAAEWLQQ
ncbi:GNAT family N-acetyltransferase [Niabella hibiscisoli]|uniref:GNAT family N-acetyltransferase n=1 Tax=Niabella hibiscisoli TaxID=1825928 RepID=UPI001F0E7D4D|nr:GNAT family N-acetyltransferase [Niabella hibiscisoli]MCH5717107.1 GNAT family N-acetyltransferase [Niabella hibiscisoli]